MAVAMITIVIAAGIFLYVFLSIGFNLTQISQEATSTAVENTTSSLKLSGKIIVKGVDANTRVGSIIIYVQHSGEAEPIDLNKSIISYTSKTDHNGSIWHYVEGSTVTWVQRGDTDTLLEPFELAMLTIVIPDTDTLGPNKKFIIEVKPPVGRTLKIVRTTPSSLEKIMSL